MYYAAYYCYYLCKSLYNNFIYGVIVFILLSMPRSNAAELITLRVNVVKALRDKWKKEREKNPYTNEHFGGFVNELLHDILEKDEFLRHYAPFLSEEGCTRETLYIKDFKQNKIAEIHFNDGKLYCSICESISCLHIQFAMATPRVAKLNITSKPIDDNIESDGQRVREITNRQRRKKQQ